MNINQMSLRSYLDSATADLGKGEKVRVPFTDQLHSEYLDLQLAGYYPELLCVRQNGDYYLARVR